MGHTRERRFVAVEWWWLGGGPAALPLCASQLLGGCWEEGMLGLSFLLNFSKILQSARMTATKKCGRFPFPAVGAIPCFPLLAVPAWLPAALPPQHVHVISPHPRYRLCALRRPDCGRLGSGWGRGVRWKSRSEFGAGRLWPVSRCSRWREGEGAVRGCSPAAAWPRERGSPRSVSTHSL